MTDTELEKPEDEQEIEGEDENERLRRHNQTLINEKRQQKRKWQRERDELQAKLDQLMNGDTRSESDERISQLEAENKRLKAQNDRQYIDATLGAAIAAAKGDDGLVLPLAREYVQVTEKDGKRSLKFVDPETGEQMTVDDDLAMTRKRDVKLPDFIEMLREKHPKAFGAAAASGAGVPSAESETGVRVVRGDVSNQFFSDHLEEIAAGKIRIEPVEAGPGDVY